MNKGHRHKRPISNSEYHILKEIERLVELLNYETVKIEINMPEDRALTLTKTKHNKIGF